LHSNTVQPFVKLRNQKIKHSMKHLSISLRLLAITAIFTLSSCKKQVANSSENNTVVVSSRTTQPGQLITVRVSQSQATQLRQSGSIHIEKEAIESTPARGTSATADIGVSGGGITPGGCSPISQATLNYWQQQANNCCCDIIVCLQDQSCAYVLILFRPSPNSGCGTGGGGQLL
jgi:hypothetical protein